MKIITQKVYDTQETLALPEQKRSSANCLHNKNCTLYVTQSRK